MVGILNYEEQRLRQQEIEVKALIAIARFGNGIQKFEALSELENHAYPKALAEKIDQQKIGEYE